MTGQRERMFFGIKWERYHFIINQFFIKGGKL